MSKLEKIKKEYDELMEKLSSPEQIDSWEEIGEKKKSLENILAKKKELDEIRSKIEENKSILKSESDKELLSLVTKENIRLEEAEVEAERSMKHLIAEKEEEGGADYDIDKKTAIIEIRAGAGGDEASLFVKDLFNMYAGYAEKKKISVKILEENKTEQGGYKILVFKMKNGNPYSLMRYEAGVHRVQRVPETEKGGRVHTSTVSVAVLPEPKKGKVKINPGDLRVETCKSSGPGGQYVNKRETAVRILHNPTGIVVTSQNERSLQQNKETALSVLEARIMEKERERKQAKEEKTRKLQIGSAMRSEKIRTYNFLQNRITDHRIEKSWYKLEEVLSGDLDDIINALREEEEREKYKDILD